MALPALPTLAMEECAFEMGGKTTQSRCVTKSSSSSWLSSGPGKCKRGGGGQRGGNPCDKGDERREDTRNRRHWRGFTGNRGQRWTHCNLNPSSDAALGLTGLQELQEQWDCCTWKGMEAKGSSDTRHNSLEYRGEDIDRREDSLKLRR